MPKRSKALERYAVNILDNRAWDCVGRAEYLILLGTGNAGVKTPKCGVRWDLVAKALDRAEVLIEAIDTLGWTAENLTARHARLRAALATHSGR